MTKAIVFVPYGSRLGFHESEIASTLAHIDYKFPQCVCYEEDMKEQNFPVESVGHDIRSTQFSRGGCCDTLTANDFKDPTIVAYAIENHPCDSRVTLTDDGIVQTLNARLGTGGGIRHS